MDSGSGDGMPVALPSRATCCRCAVGATVPRRHWPPVLGGVAWTGECCDGTLALTDFVDPAPLLGACAISVDVGVRPLANRRGSLGGARCRLEARWRTPRQPTTTYHSTSADPAAHLNRRVHGSECVEVAGESFAHEDAGDTPRTLPGLVTLLPERRRQRSGGTIRRFIRLGCSARYILCVRKGT